MTHAELELELPWYANGTSTPRERAAVERELATCEACAADVAELRALGAVLRDIDATAPAASPYAFADTMERIASDDSPRTAEPFDPIGSLRRIVAAWWSNPRTRTFGGAFAVLALVVLVTFPHLRPSDGSAAPPVGDVTDARSESYEKAEEPAGGSAPAPALRAEPPATSAAAAGNEGKDATSVRVRQLARDGTIGLLVPDVSVAIARSERIAADNFGLVTALQDDAPSDPGERHTAQLTLSVPDDRFAGTIARLAQLGGVTTRTVKTEDLTDSIVDSDARLRNLRREESDLLKIMDRSGKVGDVLEVEQQLASTRESIEKLDAESQAMRRRVAYATIAIDFSDEKVADAVPGPGSQISDAWHGAVRLLWGFTIGLVSNLLVLLAFTPYLIVAAIVVYVAIRLIRRARANRNYR